MDYNKKLDAEVLDFIARTAEFSPADAVSASIPQQREYYNTLCRSFHAGHPDGVTTTDQTIASVPCRVYTTGPFDPQSDPTVIYFHGGGYVVGDLDSHDDVCAEICARANLRVVSADYRLAPEHLHPAAFEDCWAVFKSISKETQGPIVLAGDSAGGNLAAAVSHHARDAGLPVQGQVLIYPSLGGDCTLGSFQEHANAPMLTCADMEFYLDIRLNGPRPTGDVRFAPLSDNSFDGLPMTMIASAECDPLCDDGKAYRDVIQSAGGRAIWFNDLGLVHGHLRARHMSVKSRDSFDRIVTAIEHFSRENWPYDDVT